MKNRFSETVKQLTLSCILLAVLSVFSLLVNASETENHRLRFIPVKKAPVIDGRIDDWDLRGGVFVGGELENVRDRFSLWIHAMYDDEYVYILSRWRDETPINNPETKGGHGFNGDSLQVRFILFPDTPDKCATWWDFWKDRAGKDVLSRQSPGKGNGFAENVLPNLANAQEEGVQQAFLVNPDKVSYNQEIRIPWKLLSAKGTTPAPGESFRFTVEPNFTAGLFGRITVKGIFNAKAEKLDRVFTFRGFDTWGEGLLLKEDEVAGLSPDPVRIAGGRTFPVTMEKGMPVVNWDGLIQRFAWPGFKKIEFNMPFNGYVSLNILDDKGKVVRHLQNWEQYSKGKHTVEWDGLTDATFRTPGNPVPAGNYSWEAIVHKGVKLTYRGQAGYGGRVPWAGNANDHWLGDHGVPTDIETDGKRIYMACDGAEGGRHLIGTDLEGNCLWGLQNTIGAPDPEDIAVDNDSVYILHQKPRGDKRASIVLAIADSETGGYKPWQGQKDHILSPAEIFGEKDNPEMPDHFKAIDVADGKIYLTCSDETKKQGIYILDAKTGKYERYLPLEKPGFLDVAGPVAYVIQDDKQLVSVDIKSGKTQIVLSNLDNARSVTVKGDLAYVSERGRQMRVNVYDLKNKKLVKSYGRSGGRPLIGKWLSDAMYNPAGTAISPDGTRLWVAESYEHPKRVSVWNLADGKLVKDFFGPTHYGASGGAISPRDPNVMVGEACEWKLNEKTGKADCIGVFDTDFHSFAKFIDAPNGKLYLVVVNGRYGTGNIRIFERRGAGDYRLLFKLSNIEEGKSDKQSISTMWSDLNGDGKISDNEMQKYPHRLFPTGSNDWTVNVGNDFSIYAFDSTDKLLKALRPVKIQENGVPVYDFAKMESLPKEFGEHWAQNYSSAIPNLDNTKMLLNLNYRDHPAGFLWTCVDMKNWQVLWTYPNPYFQVHGSHKAPAYEPGLFRGAFNPVGSLKIPGEVGDAWIINGNLGEWYMLTAKGYYLSRVFNGNPFEWKWPENALPGSDFTNLPSGSGGEDFGGSATQGDDGKVYIQAGKSADWNIVLSGLDDAVTLSGKGIVITPEDTKTAFAMRETALQAKAPKRELTIKKKTVDVKTDGFNGIKHFNFQKMQGAGVNMRIAYDDANLYCNWNVTDSTPWINGAKDLAQMYAGGDTVDLQIGTDPKADPKRNKATKGDIRISIGKLGDKNVAVVYRFKSDVKKPRTFSSGVIQGYVVDYVDVIPDIKINVNTQKGRYSVSAAIPWKVIGITPKKGMKLRADVGVTHGDPSGTDTRLRTYWANQQTGLVDDVVFELQVTPANWGVFILE